LDEPLKIISVILLAVIELWAAIPAGFALGLNPIIVGLSTVFGAVAGTFIVIWIGEKLRQWLLRRHSKNKDQQKPGFIQRVWLRYGMIGLGLLAPMVTGAPLGAALGISLGAPKLRLMLWMSIGIILWTALLTTACALGIAGIEKLI
jgi:hypothetical protein